MVFPYSMAMETINNSMKQQSSHLIVTNRPIGCTFCDAQVQGKISPRKDHKGKTINECRWVCSRCANLVKVGVLAD